MNDIEYLVGKYFKGSNTFSEVTSSHWKKYGEKQSVKVAPVNRSQKWIFKKARDGGGGFSY
jgi:hypothetical protein